ncbi:MAG: cytochrome P450 [Candidatus Nanopelagicaceae bacterium]
MASTPTVFDSPRPSEYREIPDAITRREAKRLQLPPGPNPALADLLTLTFMLDTPRFLQRMQERHGDVTSFFLSRKLFFGIFSAQGTYEVTVSKQHHFVKGVGFARMRKVLGEGLLTNEEPIHMQHRRMMQPPFHHGNLDSYVALMHGIIDEHTAKWKDSINLADEMMALTLEIVAQCLFGMESSKYTKPIAHSMEIAIDRIERTMLPGLERFDRTKIPYFAKFRKSSDDLVAIADEIIEKRISSKVDRRDDLLGIMLAMQGSISLPHIRDEVLTLILSGHETTANVLTWAFSYLSKNPEWQARLEAEAKEWDLSKPPSYQELEEKTPIASAILWEALRLAPPVWVAPRIAVDDVEIDGRTVPKGAHVLVSQFVTQRDSRYFEEPERFNPERWLDPEFEKALPKGAYFPFGAGSRKCLGEYFALAESRLILLIAASRFRMKNEFPKAQPRATYRPKGGVPTQLSAIS